MKQFIETSESVPLKIDGQELLTIEESSRLKQLEDVIETGARSVGEALREINESRLYRAEYRTFEEYCRSRWNRSRSYAYRLIDFAKAVKECSQNGDTAILKNEGRFRASKIARKTGRRKAPEQLSKSEQPSRIINEVDEELDRFKETAEEWEGIFLADEFRGLLEQERSTWTIFSAASWKTRGWKSRN